MNDHIYFGISVEHFIIVLYLRFPSVCAACLECVHVLHLYACVQLCSKETINYCLDFGILGSVISIDILIMGYRTNGR